MESSADENECVGMFSDSAADDDESFEICSDSSYVPSEEASSDEEMSDAMLELIPVTEATKDTLRTSILENRPVPSTTITQSQSSSEGLSTSSTKQVPGWRNACFRNVHVASYQSKDGKRDYCKPAYCYYCKNMYKSKISKHLLAVHPNEPMVRRIRELPLGTRERKAEMQKLINEGNFLHNTKVLQKGEVTLIVYRRPRGPTQAHEYVHCRMCKGFFHNKLLWIHAKRCSTKLKVTLNETENNILREARCELAPFLKSTDQEIAKLDEIVERMKETKENPGIKKICEEDQLIRQFGIYLLGRLGTAEEQRLKDQDNIRTKMRSLARLLKTLNQNEVFDHDFNYFICPQKFDLVANSVKELYQENGSAQLGINLGHYVKQASLLKSSYCLRNEDRKGKRESNEFTEMFEAEWRGKVSSVANRSKRLKSMNKRSELPLTEDLVILKDFLVKEIQLQMENVSPTYPEYVYCAHLLIARIVLFNKRRVNEVAELKVNDYMKRIRGDELDTNTEIFNSLAMSEKALLKRTELLEVRGKSTRGLRRVHVILDTDMVKGLEYLLTVRGKAGVPTTNTFLFSRVADNPQDGCEALRVVTSKCAGLSYPDRIRTIKLRKYLATTTQIMDMRDDELKLLADHMGHSVAIHTEVYRLQTSVLERTKVARALIALEDGNLNDFNLNGRQLSSVSLDELPQPDEDEADFEEDEPEHIYEYGAEIERDECDPDGNDEAENTLSSSVRGTKRRWSEEEEAALLEAFATPIRQKKNVSSCTIHAAQKKFAVLQGRSVPVIRTKINNIILGKYKKKFL